MFAFKPRARIIFFRLLVLASIAAYITSFLAKEQAPWLQSIAYYTVLMAIALRSPAQ